MGTQTGAWLQASPSEDNLEGLEWSLLATIEDRRIVLDSNYMKRIVRSITQGVL